MSNLRVLADALYVEEILRARETPPGEKLLEGPRLFERAYRLMAAGVRHEHPELDPAGVERLIAARLDLLDSLDRS